MHSPGIEPGSPAWQADIMPLDHECLVDLSESERHRVSTHIMPLDHECLVDLSGSERHRVSTHIMPLDHECLVDLSEEERHRVSVHIMPLDHECLVDFDRRRKTSCQYAWSLMRTCLGSAWADQFTILPDRCFAFIRAIIIIMHQCRSFLARLSTRSYTPRRAVSSSVFAISKRKYCSFKEETDEVADRDPLNISASLTRPDDKSFVKPKYGDKVMLMALYKPREWVVKLRERQSLPTGPVPIYHKDIIEAGYGGIVTVDGKKHLVKRLSYEDYIVTKDRVATPSYPKDMGTIALMLDLKNGDRVLEAGSGSGMLSLFLSRAVAPRGEIHSFEVREEFSQKAKENADNWDPEHNIKFYVGDVNSCEFSEPFDACVLDMMSPWLALEKAASLLKTGSSIVCVVPNVTQVIMMEELREEKKLPLYLERMTEVMNRDWKVSLPSFHPKFRSVSHTTFLVQYRKLGNEVVVNLPPREERQRLSAERREKFRAISKARIAADEQNEHDEGDNDVENNNEGEPKQEK